MVRILSRIPKIEAGGINPMGNVFNLITPDRVNVPPGKCVINTVPVRTGDNGGIIRGLGPAFNFDAVDAGLHQLLQMVNGAHIPGIENIGSFLIFKDREIFTRTLFLHERVLIAAGLGTGTPVGIPPSRVVAE